MESKICSYCDASKLRIGMCVPTKRQGMKKDITTYVSKCFDLLEDIAEGIGNMAKHTYDLSFSNGRTKSPVLWAEIGEIQPIGPELVQETTNKKCLADASLHVPLDEIKIDKTLRFVEEPVEIMDREVRSLKRSKISLVKVHWNSKHSPEFTWEREDHMKSKYPQLFINRAVEPAS
ncbi:hypothetical protein Tco_1287109 [Tanacetum coccineum]